MIPQRDTLYAAIVESGKFYDEIRSPWQSSDEGPDLSPALSYVLNDVHSTHITQEQLVTEPQSWCVIEYMKSPSTRAAATLHFRSTRGGQPRTELLSGLIHNSSRKLGSRAPLAARKRSTATASFLGSSRSRSPQGKKFKSSYTPTSSVEITSGAGRRRFVKRGEV